MVCPNFRRKKQHYLVVWSSQRGEIVASHSLPSQRGCLVVNGQSKNKMIWLHLQFNGWSKLVCLAIHVSIQSLQLQIHCSVSVCDHDVNLKILFNGNNIYFFKCLYVSVLSSLCASWLFSWDNHLNLLHLVVKVTRRILNLK